MIGNEQVIKEVKLSERKSMERVENYGVERKLDKVRRGVVK